MSNEKRVTYTVQEVSELLGISITQAYKIAREGQIPCVPVGARRYLVPKKAFDEWLNGSCFSGASK